MIPFFQTQPSGFHLLFKAGSTPLSYLALDIILKVPRALAKGPSLLLVPLPVAVGNPGLGSSCTYYHGFT